jgi:hypothetical protein
MSDRNKEYVMFINTIQQLINTTGEAHIPMEAWPRGTYSEGLFITELTEDRVIGYEYDNRKEDFRAKFNVKHDGKRFARGSDSGKCFYYFKHVGAEYKKLFDVATMVFDDRTKTATITFYAQDVTTPQAMAVIRKLNAMGITAAYAGNVGEFERAAGKTVCRPDWVITKKVVHKMDLVLQ